MADYRGPWNSITKFGHRTDAVVSGLQKYARRGMAAKMLYCADELLSLDRIYFKTLMMNRLEVILCEDVSFYFVPWVLRLLDGKWDLAHVDCICTVLAAAKKLRMPSFIRCHIEERAQAMPYHAPTLVQNLTKYALLKDDTAFAYLYCLVIKRTIWDLSSFWRLCMHVPYIDFFQAAYKKRSPKCHERFLFVFVPLLMFMYGSTFATNWDCPEFPERITTRITLDEFVFDMHTKQGRSLGRNAKDFALV